MSISSSTDENQREFDLFVSYATKDSFEVAENVVIDLERRGLRCWIAPRNIPAGTTSWPAEIMKNIRGTNSFLLLLSAGANASEEIEKELNEAARQRKTLFVIRLLDIEPSDGLGYHLNRVQWRDLFRNREDVLNEIASRAVLLRKSRVIPSVHDVGIGPTTRMDTGSISAAAQSSVEISPQAMEPFNRKTRRIAAAVAGFIIAGGVGLGIFAATRPPAASQKLDSIGAPSAQERSYPGADPDQAALDKAGAEEQQKKAAAIEAERQRLVSAAREKERLAAEQTEKDKIATELRQSQALAKEKAAQQKAAADQDASQKLAALEAEPQRQVLENQRLTAEQAEAGKAVELRKRQATLDVPAPETVSPSANRSGLSNPAVAFLPEAPNKPGNPLDTKTVTLDNLRQILASKDIAQPEKVAMDYLGDVSFKALAVSPHGAWRVSRQASSKSATEMALEGCQFYYAAEVCLLVASDDAYVADQPSPSNRVAYSGFFDPQMIPAVPTPRRAAADIAEYAAKAGPKAVAFHPSGQLTITLQAGDQHGAEENALQICNAEARQNGREGSCILYAVQNQVVLPQRSFAAITPAAIAKPEIPATTKASSVHRPVQRGTRIEHPARRQSSSGGRCFTSGGMRFCE